MCLLSQIEDTFISEIPGELSTVAKAMGMGMGMVMAIVMTMVIVMDKSGE